MWFSYGAPGFDESMWPDTYFDGSEWNVDKYIVASHVIISYAYQNSEDVAVYGTNAEFSTWSKNELFAKTYEVMKLRASEVPAGFNVFVVTTNTQPLVSFEWKQGGLKIAKEDFEAGTAAQGDATLSGAEFSIVNMSGKPVLVGGESYANGEVVKTISVGWDEDASAYTAKTLPRELPCGTYKIVESLAPDGYLPANWSKTVEITSDGQIVDVTGDPCEDEVIRGGVRVTKFDSELGASGALGGNSHGRLDTGSTLSGIEFTISNASREKVCVDGEWFNPGDVIEVISTAWDKETDAYVAQTANNELPYGTYIIQETKTNDSYLLTDGEAKTFQIRQDGVIVEASSDGGRLEFFNQVVRNDLEITKMAEDTGIPLQVAFKVTNVSTGEAHVVVTDENGAASTASSWNKHSNNTNANDVLLESDSIKASDMDSSAGVWFSLGEDGGSAPVDNSLAALPYGKYTIEELRSDSNEGYELMQRTFFIEDDSTVVDAVRMSLVNERSPKIETEETDKADGDHIAQVSRETTLVDTVWYENLKNDGTEYTITGSLMVRSTGDALVDADGNAITATETFIPAHKSGEVQLEFTFDSRLLAGEDIVAFESLCSGGVEVASHTDIDDEGQTARFVDINTTATDKLDGDKLVTGAEIVIRDEVSYEGLTPGTEYVLEASLVNAETGKPIAAKSGLARGRAMGSAMFTPIETTGTQVVEIPFNGTEYGGEKVVVFEKLYAAGVQIASHEDQFDSRQTVSVCAIDTKLTDAQDGDQLITADKVKLIDAIEYKGFVVGDSYTVRGVIMNKSTGKAFVDSQGNPVVSTAEFVAETADGCVEITFEFDASSLSEGDRLVAFEECLTVDGNIAAVHQDINDPEQTVLVYDLTSKSPYDKVGVDLLPIWALVVFLGVSSVAVCSYALRDRIPWRRS